MTVAATKIWVHVLEGLNAFACTLYFQYLLFHLRDQFGFDQQESLLCLALHGLIYTGAAWAGGRFGQRQGYLTALRLGFAGMAGVLLLASFWPTNCAVQIIAMGGWTVAQCLTWPIIEAVVSENETRAGVARRVGLYNVIWADVGALAFCSGGTLIKHLGPHSLYWLPAGLHLLQLAVLVFIAPGVRTAHAQAGHTPPEPHVPEAAAFKQKVSPQVFLKMAWLAIPFAYIAINTMLAVVPQRSRALGLDNAQAGMFWSIWFFVRLAAFAVLWQWTGWHYRFRWLLAAYVGLLGSFGVLMLAQSLWALAAAQAVFGCSAGLIYYSSLFYAMDVGEAKGEHGGMHEAAIGAGICLGPALAALTLHFLPSQPQSGAWAVAGLMVVGLAALSIMRLRASR